jgi:hypothetical protein
MSRGSKSHLRVTQEEVDVEQEEWLGREVDPGDCGKGRQTGPDSEAR